MAQAPPSPEAQAAIARTQDWVRARLRRHYEARPLLMPDRFPRREFGFMSYGPGLMQRHLAFSAAKDLRDFLVSRVPAHAYHSTAYYERPDAPTMEEKGWLGADLIFDLDADHIPKSREMTYEEMLEAVKRKIVQLHDDFLVQDFGFDEKSLRIVFSGGRGYHIHVHDERVWPLGSHERREIVDHVTGKGVDWSRIFHETPYDIREYKGLPGTAKKRLVTPKIGDPGWAGKVARGCIVLAERLERMPADVAMNYLGEFLREDYAAERERLRAAADLYENLFKVRTEKPRLIRGIDRLKEGANLEVLTDRNRDRFLKVVLGVQQIRLDTSGPLELDQIRVRGETDEPVTSDIKRLIRLPSSVHGKSGLEVVPLARGALDGFAPLRDAVPAAFTDEPVRVRLSKPIRTNLRDETFNLTPPLATVPEFAAVFLACRGTATLA